MKWTMTIRGWLVGTAAIGLALVMLTGLDQYQKWAYIHRLNHSQEWCPICQSAASPPAPPTEPE
jgi:hypothetical protein